MNDSGSHVYIVDDDEVVRDSIATTLQRDGLQFHSFGSSKQFLQAAPFARPGCAILDLKIGDTNGEQVQTRMLKDPTPLPVIVVTGYATVPVSVRMMEQGAVTVLEKPIEPKVLQSYVERAIAIDRHRVEADRCYARLGLLWSGMSERQHSVLVLLVDGLPNKTIAKRLSVSQRTIEIERSRLMEVFQVDSTAALVTKATEYRLLSRQKNDSDRLTPVQEDKPAPVDVDGSLSGIQQSGV